MKDLQYEHEQLFEGKMVPQVEMNWKLKTRIQVQDDPQMRVLNEVLIFNDSQIVFAFCSVQFFVAQEVCTNANFALNADFFFPKWEANILTPVFIVLHKTF